MQRYSLFIQFSEEDQCYLVTCPEFAPFVNMGGPIAHGDTWEEAAREGAMAVEGLIIDFEASNKALPEPNLHKWTDKTNGAKI